MLLGLVAHAEGKWHDLFRAEFLDTLEQRPALAGLVFDAHLCLAEFSLYGPTSHQEIEPFARSLLDIAARAGSTRGQAVAILMLGEAELFTGRLREAESTLSQAAKLHETAEAPSGLALALIRLAETAILRNRRWQASRLLRRALHLSDASVLAPHLAVRAHAARVLAAKDTARASVAVDEAERALFASDICQPCSIGFHVTAAMARARSGDLAGGRRHLDKAQRIAGMWQGGPWQAAVWEARGALRVAEGDRPQGLALFREAADLFARSGRPLDAARCRTADA